MSNQLLRTYNEIGKAIPSASERFVKDYSALKSELTAAKLSITELTESIENLKPLFGAQTPEGSVTSNESLTFFDTTNSPTNVTMYFNEVVGADTGWVIVN